jgi:hypothetical protein
MYPEGVDESVEIISLLILSSSMDLSIPFLSTYDNPAVVPIKILPAVSSAKHLMDEEGRPSL